ncbi:MAG: hypothetical protein IKR64_04945, partial [Treponema sp.]|nr:hypothetical protein [Treponema sp.]
MTGLAKNVIARSLATWQSTFMKGYYMSDTIFFNRELSWLEFNARVLKQGLRKELPLL